MDLESHFDAGLRKRPRSKGEPGGVYVQMIWSFTVKEQDDPVDYFGDRKTSIGCCLDGHVVMNLQSMEMDSSLKRIKQYLTRISIEELHSCMPHFLLDHRRQEDRLDNLRQVLSVQADVGMTAQGALQLVSLVRQ